MFNCNNIKWSSSGPSMKPPSRSPSMQEGMMNALGAASAVGGTVAGVKVDAPVAPTNDSPSLSDQEVGKYLLYNKLLVFNPSTFYYIL